MGELSPRRGELQPAERSRNRVDFKHAVSASLGFEQLVQGQVLSRQPVSMTTGSDWAILRAGVFWRGRVDLGAMSSSVRLTETAPRNRIGGANAAFGVPQLSALGPSWQGMLNPCTLAAKLLRATEGKASWDGFLFGAIRCVS